MTSPLPGSIKDVSTLDESLCRLELVDVKLLHLVMDKGFYSEANLTALYARHIRMKNELDMNRLRIHSAQTMDGRLFIQYIAEILLSRIRSIMKDSGELKNHSVQEVLDEMKSVRQVVVENEHSRIVTALTAFQKHIVSLFHLTF